MLIGSFSGIPYREFAAAMAPVALDGLLVVVAVIALIYRREFREEPRLALPHRPVRINRVLLWKSAAASASCCCVKPSRCAATWYAVSGCSVGNIVRPAFCSDYRILS